MPDQVAFPKPKDHKREPKPAFEVMADDREICGDHPAGRAEYKARKKLMWQRQNGICRWCGLWMSLAQSTFDHEAGRGSGGGHRDDRCEVDGVPINAALHFACNNLRGSTRAPYPFPKPERTSTT